MLRPNGWHSRGYLPHIDEEHLTQFVTFHLDDAFSPALLRQWEDRWRLLPNSEAKRERMRHIQAWLDKGQGESWLRDRYLAEIIQDALWFFDGIRYALHAWVIMPNHGHALFTPNPDNTLSDILQSWKSYTSKMANAYLHRRGTFWFPDFYDRYMRNQEHFLVTVDYIESNPVKACLCRQPEDWPWSSAYYRAPGTLPEIPEITNLDALYG